jgi:hypothetical protein
MGIRYACLWVYEVPRKMIKESFRSHLGSDVSQSEIDRLALEFFTARPRLNPEKERPFGMLVEIHHPKPCIRFTFSRSKSNKSCHEVLPHKARLHSDHSCFIDEDGVIQTSVGAGHSLPVSVMRFTRLGLKQCSEEDASSVIEIWEHMKARFPGNHICAAGGTL